MEPTVAYVDLFVPNDHENGVLGQKAIFGAKLSFTVRPMLGEKIRIDPTLSKEEFDGLLYAVITNIKHVPTNYVGKYNDALHIDAELTELDYVSQVIAIQKILASSGVWTTHSIS